MEKISSGGRHKARKEGSTPEKIHRRKKSGSAFEGKKKVSVGMDKKKNPSQAGKGYSPSSWTKERKKKSRGSSRRRPPGNNLNCKERKKEYGWKPAQRRAKKKRLGNNVTGKPASIKPNPQLQRKDEKGTPHSS